MSVSLPFLRADAAPPATFEARLSDLPVTVLVGLTGVGKSTALAALSGLRVLPNRREVTDAVMILPLAGEPVHDREERFRLTAQYRAQHPGGMAQALGTLVADTRHWGQSPVFDGLRGLDEVRYAAQRHPRWRFVALGAPDTVRVQRLLGRADAFDQVKPEQGGALQGGVPSQDALAALKGIKGVDEVFTLEQLDTLAALSRAGFTVADLQAKVKIVVSERRNYDPVAAEAFLRTLPPERALLLDTVALRPAEVAQALRAWA